MKFIINQSPYFLLLALCVLSSCVGGKKMDTLQKEIDVMTRRTHILETKLDSVVDVTIKQKREIYNLNELLSQERARNSAYNVQVKESSVAKKSSGTSALSREDEYTQKANFVLNFGKFIFWPRDYLADKDFIIGVYGKSSIYDKLVDLTSGKTINSKKIIIQMLEVGKEISDVHIVFFSESANATLTAQVNKIKKKPILVITENLESINKNYMLNFLDSGEKVKFSLNRQNANAAGLNVNLDLMKLSF